MSALAGSTLVLIEVDDVTALAAEIGAASLELYLSEFRSRVERFARASDQVLKVQPHKLCVVLRGVTDAHQIELAGAKLDRLFAAPAAVLDRELRLSVHAAFVPPEEGPRDVKSGLRLAETGLRRARLEGRSWVIARELDALAADAALTASREVEAGIERGEFVLFYQPQVSAAYGSVVGAEGLMRWNHPQRGLLTPNHFLPYCRTSAMLRDLTSLALKSAIGSCATWPGTPSVSVNLPPALLGDEHLSALIGDALAIFGLAPERLVLEITEEAMIDDPDAAVDRLQALRDTGMRIAIDDFGTGYSSLSLLRRLPVQELKIDRSFVVGMREQPRDRVLVQAIIDLAHNFSMKVVAEGIEDDATAELLRGMGCDLLQGYLFGRPMPSRALAALL
ncbi:MAG: EAL domain-containing protein [Pseudomonadales bacterium]